MVFYFTSVVLPERPYTIYMGLDKYENEDLIKYGWPEDVWFHVDKLSSAHVYLRLKKNEKLEDIPAEVLTDCAQLVKANSIQGCKMNNIDIVYTMWDNLKKTGDMAVGQVGFHRNKEVKKVHVEKKINDIVNRLNKTKIEKKDVDLMSEKEDRNREERNEAKKIANKKREQEKLEIQQRKQDKEMRSYKTLFENAEMENNAENNNGNDSDDFM